MTGTRSIDHRLDGVTLSVGDPRVVAEVTRGRCWFPDLLRFSTGELMLNHSVNGDSNDNAANAQAVYLSTNGGRTFDFAYDVNGFHNAGGEPRVGLPDGRVVGTSTFLRPEPAGQNRRFVAHRWIYDQGGRRYAVEPWGATVEGVPRDVEPWPNPSRTWWSRINWFSDVLPLDGGRQWLSTISMRCAGDPLETTVAVVSDDEGRHWRYLSTIAGPDAVPDGNEGFDEPCLVRLADGDVMCVSRVGAGAGQFLARSYSADGGRSWSALDRLPAYSVAPQVLRLRGGLLVLSTGRPGIVLWVSTDPRGARWQPIDLVAHHNRIAGVAALGAGVLPMTAEQTTAYTAMVEAADNHVLLVYDRTPFGWEAVPPESGERSQIYVLEFTAERI